MDIKADGAAGGAWYEIAREALKLIGTELQRAKGRGQLAGKSASYANGPSSSYHTLTPSDMSAQARPLARLAPSRAQLSQGRP